MSVPRLPRPPRVGVLAVQGGFREHAAMLTGLGAEAVLVRTAAAVDGLDGLVIPGGETTTLRIVAGESGTIEAIRAARAAGLPVLGTCAGLIALADRIAGGDPVLVGGLDITVARNAYGSQVASFEATVDVRGVGEGPCEAVFIRAPRIVDAGPGVTVIATLDGEPVAVRQDDLMGVAFHPELTSDGRFHQWLVDRARTRMDRQEIEHTEGFRVGAQ